MEGSGAGMWWSRALEWTPRITAGILSQVSGWEARDAQMSLSLAAGPLSDWPEAGSQELGTVQGVK